MQIICKFFRYQKSIATFVARNTTAMKLLCTLDRRRQRKDGTYPVKLYIYHRAQTRIATNMFASSEEWDDTRACYKVRGMNDRTRNILLRDMLNKVESLLFNLELSGELSCMTDKQLRVAVEAAIGSQKAERRTLVSFLDKGAVGKAERTQRLFKWCRDKVAAYDGKVQINDVSKKWVADFQKYLETEGLRPNSVALLLSYVSRACSIAVTDEVISRNPCVGMRKPKEDTRKRSLPVEVMRQLRDMPLEGNKAWARDMFFLSFYLIGINMADLYSAHTIVAGRLEYKRRKTGTLYSVAVPAEAAAIIEKYKGDGKLLDTSRFTSSGTMCTALTYCLRKLHPGLSTYYARHTWASMAAELDIPIETISHALGHKIGSPVTAIYVAYNQRKVDDANRRVIDYLNADKRGME